MRSFRIAASCVALLFSTLFFACGDSSSSSDDGVSSVQDIDALEQDSLDVADTTVAADTADVDSSDTSKKDASKKDSSKKDSSKADTSKTEPGDSTKVEPEEPADTSKTDSTKTEPGDSTKVEPEEPADTSKTDSSKIDTTKTEPQDTVVTAPKDTVVDPCAKVEFDETKNICYMGKLYDRYVTRNGFRYENFIDKRDGQIYRSIQLGDQVWMAQNLNFEIDSSWCAGGSVKVSSTNENADCDAYGRLYRWSGALGIDEDFDHMTASAGPLVDTSKAYQGICPEGWHVPDYHEWYALEDYIYQVVDPDTTYALSTHLKSTELWAEGQYNVFSQNGEFTTADVPKAINSVGFEALPVGTFFVYNGKLEFEDFTLSTYFWSVSEADGEYVYAINFNHNIVTESFKVYKTYSYGKNEARSLRCIKDVQ